MSTGMTVPEAASTKMTRQQQRAELAHYLAQQPRSKQAFHKWMQALEVAGLAIIAAWFVAAMYVSINHAAVPGTAIAAAWFAFPVSLVPVMILGGVHTIVLRASVPSALPGRAQTFVTGSKAMRLGWTLVATGLAAGAFWGVLAWAVWSFDLALIGVYTRILSTALSVVIPAAIVLGMISSVYRQFVRPR